MRRKIVAGNWNRAAGEFTDCSSIVGLLASGRFAAGRYVDCVGR